MSEYVKLVKASEDSDRKDPRRGSLEYLRIYQDELKKDILRVYRLDKSRVKSLSELRSELKRRY